MIWVRCVPPDLALNLSLTSALNHLHGLSPKRVQRALSSNV